METVKEMDEIYSNNSNGQDDSQSINNTSLSNLLKPLIWSMQAMGLMHRTYRSKDKEINQSNLSKTHTVPIRRKVKRKTNISAKLYSVIVLIILLLNAVKFTIAICLHSDFALRINNLVWSWQCFFSGLILFGMCYKDRVLLIMIQQQAQIEMITEKDVLHCLIKRQSLMVIILVSVSWLLCCINMVYISFAMYGPYTDLNQSIETIIDPLPTNNVTKIISLVFHFFDTVAWVFPVTFYCTICNILKSWFKLCNDKLQKTVENSPNEFPESFEQIRRNHFDLCQLVCNLDRSLKYIAFVTYAFTIPIVCFLLYELLMTSMDSFGVGLSIFWMTVEASIVIALSLAGAFLHEQVTLKVG